MSEVPQNELTAFCPRSPYAVAKLYAHWMTITYRESYDFFACAGVLFFNHESPLRGLEFVTRKITHGLGRIHGGQQDGLEWAILMQVGTGVFVGDYVEGMWLMLQESAADDYVLATGQIKSVRRFCELAAGVLGYELVWEGKGVESVGIHSRSEKALIRTNSKFYRPAEADLLSGNASNARTRLGWSAKTDLPSLWR